MAWRTTKIAAVALANKSATCCCDAWATGHDTLREARSRPKTRALHARTTRHGALQPPLPTGSCPDIARTVEPVRRANASFGCCRGQRVRATSHKDQVDRHLRALLGAGDLVDPRRGGRIRRWPGPQPDPAGIAVRSERHVQTGSVSRPPAALSALSAQPRWPSARLPAWLRSERDFAVRRASCGSAGSSWPPFVHDSAIFRGSERLLCAYSCASALGANDLSHWNNGAAGQD